MGGVCIMITLVFSWRGPSHEGYKQVISSDGKGYYAYLPAIFMDHNLGEETKKEYYINRVEERSLNKYFCGTALLWLPFFVLAALAAWLLGLPVDGFSPPFHMAVSIAGWIYLFIGLWALKKLLLRFGVRPVNVSITLLLTLFGTNLLYYATFHPSMSHTYSFALITLFMLGCQRLCDHYSPRMMYLLTINFALILLVRPHNGIVIVLLPFFAGSWTAFKALLKTIVQPPYHLVLSFMLLLAILSIQPLVWWIQIGEVMTWSYRGEGFYWLAPEMVKILFSFKKGLFIYTPMAAVGLLAFYFIKKHNRYQFFVLAGLWLLLIYYLSTWWSWHFANSFGHRAFIDFYATLAIALGLMFNALIKWRRTAVLSLCGVLVAYNLVLGFQFAREIIPQSEMNFDKFRYIFLKTSNDYIKVLGGLDDVEPYNKFSRKQLWQEAHDFGKDDPLVPMSLIHYGPEAQSSGSAMAFTGNEFNGSLKIPTSSDMMQSTELYIELALSRYELEFNSSSEARLVFTIVDNETGELEYYQAVLLNEIRDEPTRVWKRYRYKCRLKPPRDPNSYIHCYVWNKGMQQFLIDDLELAVYGYQHTANGWDQVVTK